MNIMSHDPGHMIIIFIQFSVICSQFCSKIKKKGLNVDFKDKVIIDQV